MRSALIDSSKKAGTYGAPTLKVYGGVATLTASGSGADTENGVTSACTPQGTKRPC